MPKTLPVLTGVASAIALCALSGAEAQPLPTRMAPASSRASAPFQAPASAAEGSWSEGSRTFHQGVSALSAADTTLTDAARKGVDAMGRKNTAAASAQAASEEFRRLSQATPTSPEATEAQRWAGVVQAAANKWQGFQAQEREATRDLNAALQQNANAQKAVDAAMSQIERGRQLLAQIQQSAPEAQPAAPAAPTR